MNPNQRTKLYMNLREHLKADGLQFFERPQERQLLLLMRTDSMTLVQVASVRGDGTALRLETKIPLVVPEARRVAAADMVTRLNRLTERGHYDLDLDSGDMIFRVDAHALGTALMPGLLVRLLAMALQPVVRDWPVLDGVIARDEDCREAIRRNAERLGRLHEAKERNDAAAKRAATRRKKLKDGPGEVPPEIQKMIDALGEPEGDEPGSVPPPKPTKRASDPRKRRGLRNFIEDFLDGDEESGPSSGGNAGGDTPPAGPSDCERPGPPPADPAA